jgi:hypothetical protein
MSNAAPSASPDSLLSEQVRHWQAHQRNPKFVAIGIFEPANYWKVQSILSEGPEAWEREYQLLERLEGEPKGDFPGIPEAILESLAAPFQSVIESLPVRKHDTALDVLSFAHFFLQPFFRDMAGGFDATVVGLAEDDQAEKPSRRFGWHRETLLFAVDSEEERLAVFRRVMAEGPRAELNPRHWYAPGYTVAKQAVALRRSAMRWMPACLPETDELFRFLAGFGQDSDPLVKYWAATHLAHIFLDRVRPDWLCDALCFGLSNGDFGMGIYEDETDLSARTADTLVYMGVDELRRAVVFLENREEHHATAWWEILAQIFLHGLAVDSTGDDFFDALRDRLKAKLTMPQIEASNRYFLRVDALKKAWAELKPAFDVDAFESFVTERLVVDPPYSVSDVVRWVEGASRITESVQIANWLESPIFYLFKLPLAMGVELERQELQAGVDQAILARAKQRLQEAAPIKDERERRALLAILNATTPYAITDYLIHHGKEIGGGGLIDMKGYWNRKT